jgi:hypothetical protein
VFVPSQLFGSTGFWHTGLLGTLVVVGGVVVVVWLTVVTLVWVAVVVEISSAAQPSKPVHPGASNMP